MPRCTGARGTRTSAPSGRLHFETCQGVTAQAHCKYIYIDTRTYLLYVISLSLSSFPFPYTLFINPHTHLAHSLPHASLSISPSRSLTCSPSLLLLSSSPSFFTPGQARSRSSVSTHTYTHPYSEMYSGAVRLGVEGRSVAAVHCTAV